MARHVERHKAGTLVVTTDHKRQRLLLLEAFDLCGQILPAPHPVEQPLHLGDPRRRGDQDE